MKILGIETTTGICEVSLALGNNEYFYEFIDKGLVHSEMLIPLIEDMLARFELKATDLDGVAVNVGPGSFTGIRVGVAVARILAQALNIKIYPIIGLHALSFKVFYANKNKDILVCPLIDALRGEAYSCLYEFKGGEGKKLRDYGIVGQEDIKNLLIEYKKKDKEIIFIGAGIKNFEDLFLQFKENMLICNKEKGYLNDTLVKLAEDCFSQREVKNFYEAVPFYIRRTAAEEKKNDKARD